MIPVVCSRDCGVNGFCNEQGECKCLQGWTGEKCETLTCDARCGNHGQCKNGSCICSVGYNGKYCTLGK